MKIVSCTLAVLLLLGLCACGSGGNIDNVLITTVPSTLYTEAEINDAIQVILKEFKGSWSGCTLTELSYAGDEINARETAYYLGGAYSGDYLDAWGDFDQVMILISSFDTDSDPGDGGLNSNFTYSNWNWILVRSNCGAWRHVDHGY